MAVEAPILCYGSAVTTTNFTGDNDNLINCTTKVGTPTLDNHNADFPVENLCKYDLNATWRSTYGTDAPPNEYADVDFPLGLGSYDVTGYPNYATFWNYINYDLTSPAQIDVVAIINHNFTTLFTYANSQLHATEGLSIWLNAGNSLDTDGSPSGASIWRMDLSEYYDRDPIVVRPCVYRRYWQLYIRLGHVYVGGAHMAAHDPVTIGRIVLNETGYCWQPSHSFDRNVPTEWKDPSIVYENQGQARRVIEKTPYRVWSIPFEGSPLTTTEVDELETAYQRQGTRRPIFFIKDPHNVPTNTETPDAADPAYHCMYGYFSDSWEWESMVAPQNRTTLEFTEQVG